MNTVETPDFKKFIPEEYYRRTGQHIPLNEHLSRGKTTKHQDYKKLSEFAVTNIVRQSSVES